MKPPMHTVALLLFAFAANAAPRLKVEDRFNQWLTDGDGSINALTTTLAPELRQRAERDLGSGLRRIPFNGDGQYLLVDAVLLGDTVLYVSAGKLKREFDRPKLLRHLAAPRIEVPAQLVTAYERLFFPYDDLLVGWMCGWTRKPAPGKPDIDLLVRASRYDLIANILQGANPEGRVYAAVALDQRETSPEVRAMIEKVFASPLLIRRCSSDVIYFSPASELRQR